MVRLRSAARELVLVAVLFLAYKGIRLLVAGHAEVATANAGTVWHLERVLGLPSELAWQQAIAGHHWLVLAANCYYAFVHFPATAAGLLWLYLRRRAMYLRTRRILAGLTAAALVVHVWFPLAPPRLVASTGLVDTGTVYGPAVYGPPDTDTLSNQYAAMPSLHVGWAIAIAVALVAATRGRLRWLWLAHPVTTLAVVVTTGNHYWLDAVVAVALLVGVAAVVVRWRTLLALAVPPLRRYGLRTLGAAVALVAVAVSVGGRVSGLALLGWIWWTPTRAGLPPPWPTAASPSPASGQPFWPRPASTSPAGTRAVHHPQPARRQHGPAGGQGDTRCLRRAARAARRSAARARKPP
jgi:hypothetical protein